MSNPKHFSQNQNFSLSNKGEVNTIGAPNLHSKGEICSKQVFSFKKIARGGANETELIPRVEEIAQWAERGSIWDIRQSFIVLFAAAGR